MLCNFAHICTYIHTSGGNLFKNRPRASTSEYKQPPINLRLFQNTVKFLDNFFSPKKQKSENEKNFTQMPDSPLLNTINSIVIFSYLYFNIWITAPGYPSNGTLGKKGVDHSIPKCEFQHHLKH